MTLYDFISQMSKTIGDTDDDESSLSTVIQYINEEIRAVALMFPEINGMEGTVGSSNGTVTISASLDGSTVYPTRLTVDYAVAKPARWTDLIEVVLNDL